MYESYQTFRPMAIFGGILGLVQSTVWIAMCVTGIVAYYCNIDYSAIEASMGSLTELTFYHIYFKGPCYVPLPNVDFTVLDNLNIMTPDEVFPWLWVYMVLSVFWALSSISLITNATQKHIKHANILLSIWILITVAQSAIDLALGIIFGVDLETMMRRANQLHIVPEGYPHSPIIAAQISAAIMMTIALRGFILWIANVLTATYFFREMFKISTYNKFGRPAGAFPNRPFMGRNSPVEAFGKRSEQNLWITPPQSSPQSQSNSRALYDERRRHYDNQQPFQQPFQQSNPHPMRPWENDHRREHAESVARELSQRQNTLNSGPRNDSNYPDPDYSPTIPRVNTLGPDSRAQIRSAVRASRL